MLLSSSPPLQVSNAMTSVVSTSSPVEITTSTEGRKNSTASLFTSGLTWESFSQSPRRRMSSTSIADARAVWRNTDAVCFDVDSTVIQDEAIDELAKFCGKGEEVSKITIEAMGGKMSFNESLKKRLGIIRPSMNQIREFIRTNPPRLTPGIRELVSAIHSKGIPIYLISGGFRGLIGPVALELNIPLENIYANKLKFYLNGEYGGFDESEPTCRSGGKASVISTLKAIKGYSSLVMIGDGATDLETCPPADAFIGFGGNAMRPEVAAKAQWYVTDFQELLNALNS